MSKVTARVFKVLLFTTLIIIAGTIISYLVIMYSLNHKIDAISSSIRSEVSRNNYMSEEARDVYYEMFSSILKEHSKGGSVDITQDGNGVFLSSSTSSSNLENLVRGIKINYNELRTVKAYGNYHTILIEVYVGFLDFTNRSNSITGFSADTSNMRKITYVYRVPCLRYIK